MLDHARSMFSNVFSFRNGTCRCPLRSAEFHGLVVAAVEGLEDRHCPRQRLESNSHREQEFCKCCIISWQLYEWKDITLSFLSFSMLGKRQFVWRSRMVSTCIWGIDAMSFRRYPEPGTATIQGKGWRIEEFPAILWVNVWQYRNFQKLKSNYYVLFKQWFQYHKTMS